MNISLRTKVLILVWMLASPTLYFLLFVKSDTPVLSWIPNFIFQIQEFLMPFFHRSYVY